MNKKKVNALAEFLGCEVEEVTQGHNENNFECSSEEYLVLTDEEADRLAKEEIKESVWAFTPDFIIDHCSALDYDEPSYKILEAIQGQCESGNDAILKLIDDLGEFVEDAICCDGRGHFLSSYDGSEDEMGEFYIYRTN